MPSSTKKKKSETPWWLGGNQICSSCQQTYVLEMEARCYDCDAPLCPVCVIAVKRTETYCSSCRPN